MGRMSDISGDHFGYLAERLGPTLTAFLACSDDVTGRGADLERLGAARSAWADLTAINSEDATRSWFIAANPRLSGDAPVEQLRAGHTKAVITAARAMAHGEVAGA